MKKIQNLYLDPSQPGSYSGLETFFHALKNQKKKVDKDKLRKWLQAQEGYTLHYPNLSKFPRNRIVVNGIDNLWQADLADFQNISEYNDGYNYLLICIDVFSKYLMVEKLMDKNAKTTLEGFKRICERSHRFPKQLQTDDGKEFINATLQNYLAKNNINFYTISSDKKACIAERVIRTLKEKMYRYFTQENTYTYVDVLDELVESYNNTYHRTIKMAPNEVNDKNEEKIFENIYLYGDVKPLKYKYQIGDKVRLSNVKRVFKKGYLKKWTLEIFEVTKTLPRSPPVYKIKDYNNDEIDGVFYEEELQKVFDTGVYKINEIIDTRKAKKGVTEYLVNFRGYPPSHQVWVSNIIDLTKKKK
jgi:hypothetical protein